jgi:ZipA, C-terminal FtsZ-binding domain
VNSLQIGLIAIGALVVAVLFLLNWWQSRRAKARDPLQMPLKPAATVGAATKGAASTTRAGPVADDLRVNTGSERRTEASPYERTEPRFDAQTVNEWVADARAVAVDPQATERSAPTQSAALTAAEEHAEMTVVPTDAPAVPATFAAAATEPSAERATYSAAQSPAIKAQSEWPFDERLHVHASFVNLSGGPFDAAPFVAVAGRATGWVRLFRQSPWERYNAEHVGSVQQLVLALPLASRQGPIEARDMDAWQFALSELSTEQGCEAHFHGFRDAPHRAAELDSFLAAVDIMPDVYLVKKDGGHWTGTRLRGTLEANGFRLQSDGRFAYHEVESDAVIFHAVDGFERPFTPERLRTEAITALRFSIEPVRLAHPLVRYDSFRQSLRALSKLLDADLKSSEGALLDDTQFAAMRDDVKTAMDAIAAAGIEPGSDTARSLFG